MNGSLRLLYARLSGDRMNRLALGTVQFGSNYGIANQSGQVPRIEAESMMKLALKSGINMIDTAISYGESEVLLGKIGVNSFKVITKLPRVPSNCINIHKWLEFEVRSSLLRLGITSIYGVLLHHPDQLLRSNGKLLYQALQTLKEEGKVKKVGISIYSPSELAELLPIYQFDIVQAPFNLVDRRLFNSGWMYRMKDCGIEVHTRSAFLQGLLLLSKVDIPSKFLHWSSLWDQWDLWLKEHDASAIQACLTFPLSFPEIDRVIVGADSLNHLDQIIKAAKNLTKESLPNLNSEHENLINPVNWSLL